MKLTTRALIVATTMAIALPLFYTPASASEPRRPRPDFNRAAERRRTERRRPSATERKSEEKKDDGKKDDGKKGGGNSQTDRPAPEPVPPYRPVFKP